MAFLERGQLLLVAVSAMGEPPAALRRQLILVHSQVQFHAAQEQHLPSIMPTLSFSRIFYHSRCAADFAWLSCASNAVLRNKVVPCAA